MINELFIKNCGDTAFYESFSEIYEKARIEYEADGVFFLKEE